MALIPKGPWNEGDPDELNCRSQHLSPERKLLAAMLATVEVDLRLGDEKTLQSLEDWIFSEEIEPFSFLWTISHLHLDGSMQIIRDFVGQALDGEDKLQAEGESGGKGILCSLDRARLSRPKNAAVLRSDWRSTRCMLRAA